MNPQIGQGALQDIRHVAVVRVRLRDSRTTGGNRGVAPAGSGPSGDFGSQARRRR